MGWNPERRSPIFNVKADVNGNTLTITVDLSQEKSASKSGKTIIIASSEGNAPIPGKESYFLGLNVYRYANPK